MRVLLVDDSMLVRGMLRALLESIGYEIAGEEGNGKKGVEAALRLRPDLVVMDVNMPVMDGITATGLIMKENPLPVVIFTSEDVAEVGYRAINEGALEVIPKPDIGRMNDSAFREEMRSILEQAVKFGVRRRHPGRAGASGIAAPHRPRPDLIVIGASTGGPSAVRTLLSGLSGDFPVPIILTQHIETGFDRGYAEWLNEAAALTVRIAEPEDRPSAGEVIVAPATHHLVCSGSRLRWDDGPRLDNQKPSVDRMFFSASKEYGSRLTGILLTGMGRDGAEGCLRIIKNGGDTIVQDEESSMIFGMPKAAIESGGASMVLPLQQIAAELEVRIR